MAGKGKKGNAGDGRDAARPFDLADIEAQTTAHRASTADTEISAAIAAAKADRISQFARGEFDGSASAILKRALADADPLGTAIERAGLFGSGTGIGKHTFSDALSGRDLASQVAASTAASSLVDQATAAAARGSLVDRTAREIYEADRKMSALILGTTFADRNLSALQEAKARAGLFEWGSHHATGSAAMAALAETYAALGMGLNRDHVLGVLGGMGSLATIAAGLADPASDMRLRASAMFAETQSLIGSSTRPGAIDSALRAGFGDIFPGMRPPRASEIEAVMAGAGSLGEFARRQDWAAGMRRRLEELAVPWIRTDLPDASIAAMARLTSLDGLIGHASPADPDVVDALRARLGDYRDDDGPEEADLDDPVVRTGYQLERGFDPVLTVLPTALVAVMFSPFSASDQPVPVDPDHLENAVRMLLKRLEHALRKFISAKLAELHGESWFDTLPSELRRAWTAGRQKDVDEGRTPGELIDYADMEHYRRIIEHPQRWAPLFEPVFKDPAAIRETLRRIAVVRNPGAHFRAVTLEDLIVLRAEGVHLAKWLGIRLGD